MNSVSHEMIYVIVDKDKGSKVLKEARKHGIDRGTILNAHGTLKSRVLNFLSLYNVEKEIVIMGADKELVDKVCPILVDKFGFNKKSKGILYTIPVGIFVGKEVEKYDINTGDDNMYKLINIIVEKGHAQSVIEFANEAGARGGTVLNARGSGTAQTVKLFNIEIEPEKEIVMIIANNNDYEKIVNSLVEKLEIEKPGKGIIYVQDINKAYGIYEEN